MHTVFINDKPFRIVNAFEADEWKGNTGLIFIAEQEMSIEDAINELEETPSHPGFIYLAANTEVAWQLFISFCTLSEAAGGLVKNEKDEYLIIFRKGKYALPKGKMEYDESPEQCAIREVEEECGVKDLQIEGTLDKSFHTYRLKEKRYLKKTHWFSMRTSSQPLNPQSEEEIEKAEWMNADQIRAVALRNTYASIEALLIKNIA